ncbi:MAG: hypothetical protein L7T84_16540 [Akkermansiaceae bacterium]|nr:hypothetical protein [Akkermansiaceae bacterium]
MDNSLKELESQLESLLPRGLTDEGEASCSALIDKLVAGEVDDLAPYRSGLSWKASAAAAVALGIGLGSGWWLGKGVSNSEDFVGKDPVSASYVAEFDIIAHPTKIVSEGLASVYVDDAGEVREVWNEVKVEKETIRPVGTNNVITWSKKDRYEIEVPKSQF